MISHEFDAPMVGSGLAGSSIALHLVAVHRVAIRIAAQTIFVPPAG
ncbi:hypothetical protein QTH97_30215 [Variovorax sp. J22R24]|nr:hypothetical protein [Variovorax sp. J22R24]MDM0109248.1 hypothetical protein [Variovorax sp. J22R24]